MREECVLVVVGLWAGGCAPPAPEARPLPPSHPSSASTASPPALQPTTDGDTSDRAAPDPEHWATWREWAVPPLLPNPNKLCLAELGCSPDAPKVPACRPELRAISVSQFESERADNPNTRRVLLRGRLRRGPGLTTALDCGRSDGGRACCNSAFTYVVLEEGGHQLMLTEEGHPEAFLCRGDESSQCCGFARVPGLHTVVEGEIRAWATVLTAVRICALPDE